jgi:hypothetical protein
MPSQRGRVVQRAVSTLTHQSMTLELDDVMSLSSMSYDDRNRLMQRSTNEGRMRSDVARRLNEFFERYLKQMTPCECVAERMTSKKLDKPASSGRQQQQQRRPNAAAAPRGD